jgi:ketosteroid isomerase-like protein
VIFPAQQARVLFTNTFAFLFINGNEQGKYNTMKNCFVIVTVLILFAACERKQDNTSNSKESNKLALMESDRAFSALSGAKGMKNAFIEYIDSNGVLLRPNHLPIVGANAIDFLIQENDSGYSLTWEPQYAEAAASGELGYTYGIYELHLKSKDTSLYGSYISVWKKQQDGKWKFVLDTGNEGLGND